MSEPIQNEPIKSEEVQPAVNNLSGEDNWGALPEEPCRHCHEKGGVQFLIDDSPHGKNTSQIVRCTKCRNAWDVDGRQA